MFKQSARLLPGTLFKLYKEKAIKIWGRVFPGSPVAV
jgi:hypothetical protein